MVPGNREIGAEVTVRLAVRADLAASRAPYAGTSQVARAGEAQLAQAAGQSRGARC